MYEYCHQKVIFHKFYSAVKKIKFDVWYEERSKYIYNFQEELEAYCVSDVKLLKEGFLAFRQIILDITRIDPFEKSFTIASLFHLVFRTLNVKERTIGVIPALGLNPKQNQSKLAFQWI